MKILRLHKGMTPGRIIGLALALLLCAQLVMITIGLQYATSIYANIQAQEADAVASQLEQNMVVQLNEVQNLISLLSMTDMNRFFTSYMNLREPGEVAQARVQLQLRFSQLKSGLHSIESIYFIGENKNQKSVRILGDTAGMTDVVNMRVDSLHYANLDGALYGIMGQFLRLDAAELSSHSSMDSAMLSDGEREDIRSFLDDMDGHIVLLGGSGSTIHAIVLREDALSSLLPADATAGAAYTLVSDDGAVVWSTTKDNDLLRGAASGAANINTREGSYSSVSRRMATFQLTLVCSQRTGVFENRQLLLSMTAVSALTLTVAFLLSFFYLKFVFRPFRRISKRMDARSGAPDGDQLFHPIAEPTHSRFHTFTLRNKLVLLFCIALIPLISADALLYSQLLGQETDRWMAQTAQKTGGIAAIGVDNQAQAYANIANQVATSDRYGDYIVSNNSYSAAPYDTTVFFPGIGSISYFALLDTNGTCTFTSILTYNRKIFDIASTYLKDQNEPYWLYNYSNPVGKVSVALLRRVHWEGDDEVYWLLIVPKDDAFPLTQTDRIRVDYTLANGLSAFFAQTQEDSVNSHNSARHEAYLDRTKWTLSAEYVFSGVAALRQAYQERFVLSVLLVFLLSGAVVMRISTMLTRPILHLKDAMTETWADGRTRLLEYDSADEIGGIIHSYNRMIVRLEEATQENLRITRENAVNKIRENELLSMKARAEFSMLQAQINPHFLHNTLATINMLCLRHGDNDTSGMVTALGDLLRYSISVGTDTATLDQEMRHAANYIKIQQARFGNSFQATFDLPQELRRCLVLRTILQPLIENAIKHGFEGWQDGGNITIRAQLRDGLLCLSVGDDGVGMDADTLERLRGDLRQTLDQWQSYGNSIGLRNVYHRLKLRYGDALCMNIQSELMAGTMVELCFPPEYGASALPSDPVDNGN